ncbi:tetratricopeptide repeat protein [Ectobacillus funiculus]
MQWVEAKEIREHLDLGNKYYAEAQYEEAIIEYEKVLELDEKNVEARIGLVKSYRALNKVVEARKVLVAGIQIAPKEPRFYSDLVDIYLAEGNVLEAVKVLDEGLSAIKDDSLIKKRTEISNDLELTVDRTLLQVDETANLQVVYHSRVISDAEDKQEAGSEQGTESEQSVPNDSDNGEAVKEESSNEQGASDSGNSDSEHSGEKTTNVSAVWSLSTKGPGSLAKDKGEANVFSAKQPGTVRVTAKVGSISKDATIEVKEHVLREIKVQTSASAVKPSEVVQLVAKGFDAKGEEIEVNPAWSIKSGAGTLSEDTGPTNTFTTEEEGPTEIVVSQDKIEASVTIAVEKKQFVLTKISNGQGTIQSNPNDKEFTDGDVITLTATPAQGWEFSHWAGDASGTDPKVIVKMDQNKTVEAVFTKNPEYTISASVEGNGSIAKSPSDGKYLKGATVTLEAIPNKGWKFERWEGDISATNQKVTLTMDGNKAVRAIFSRIPESYQLTTEATGEGSIDRTPNADVYAEGTEVRLTAKPKEGWKFDHWTGAATGTQSTVAVTMDEEKTVKAVFVKVSQPSVETYTLQTSVEGEGTVQAQPAQDKYEAGTAVQLTAKPKEGWKFDHWTGAATGTQSTVAVTMDGEKTVKAIFVKVSQPPVETYTLQTSVEGEGTVQPQPAQDSYEAGTAVQLTATPKEGWSFKEWSGDASGETNQLSVHMDSNKQIKAVSLNTEQ